MSDDLKDESPTPVRQKIKPVDEIIRNCLGIVKEDLRSGLPKAGARQDAIEEYMKDKDFK